MKANELRIGNYVWDDYFREMVVSAIGERIITKIKYNDFKR